MQTNAEDWQNEGGKTAWSAAFRHLAEGAAPPVDRLAADQQTAAPGASAGSWLRWTTGLATGAAALAYGAAAHAGGYVPPIIDIAPPPPMVMSGAGGDPYWLALIPLALLAFAGLGGGSGGSPDLAPVPGDYGGPCFCEGTLIWLERGWVPVEAVEAGDRVATSKGFQTILAVDSWQPTEFRDRACVIQGVRLSSNHGVSDGQFRVLARDVTDARARIDGSRYFHILVKDHSWLFAKNGEVGAIVSAESLLMTADLKLAKQFPELVAHHATMPVAPTRVPGQTADAQAAQRFYATAAGVPT